MMGEKQLQEEDQRADRNYPLSNAMFKRENRLVSGIRFNNSYSFSVPQFVLKERKNGLLLNRFGVVVSKKIDKRAVERNKIKRIFRNALVNLNNNMIVGHDILFIVKIGTLSKTEEVQLSIKNALEKAGLMKMINDK